MGRPHETRSDYLTSRKVRALKRLSRAQERRFRCELQTLLSLILERLQTNG